MAGLLVGFPSDEKAGRECERMDHACIHNDSDTHVVCGGFCFRYSVPMMPAVHTAPVDRATRGSLLGGGGGVPT